MTRGSGSPALRFLQRLLLVIGALASPALANTIHVPADQPTIQAGIDAANPGDTVLVAPGTYYENIDFKGKAITVTSSGGAAATIIDGGAKTGAAVVAFLSGETRSSLISNFTIRNGGSGISTVLDNPSGGVYAYQSAPTILNNIITGNLCQGVINDSAAALIQGNTISATIGQANGYCLLDRGEAILEYGYDLNLGTGVVPTIQGNIIENNVQGIYGWSGGIMLWGGDYTVIQGNTIRNNVGTESGAISSANTNTVYILQNLIYGNSAGDAGAINLQPPDASVGPFIGILAGNTISDNNVTYFNTYSGDAPASQVYLSGNLAQYLLVNNIIVGNKTGTAAVNCDVGYSYLAITPLVFDHNDIFAGAGVAYSGSCPDQTGAYGNINADPQFVSESSANYQLSASSPALDSGNNSAPMMPATDFNGSPRVQDSTGKGYPVVDMGALEHAGQTDANPTTLTLTPSEYTFQTYGNPPPLTFTATLASSAGTPTGPVTVDVDGVPVTTISIGSSGTATFSLPLSPGLHAFTSTYPGSGAFPPAESVKFYLLLPQASTSLTLASNPNPSNLNQAVTFTVTASASDGSVPSPITLTDMSTNGVLATLTPNSSAGATFTTSSLAVGAHSIQATYAGDASRNPSSTQIVQQVINGNATITTLTCQPNSFSVGLTALLAASVTSQNGTPTGSITFTDNGTVFSTQNLLHGTTNVTYIGSVAGTHTINAEYTPTGAFFPSSASCSENVEALPTRSVLAVTPQTAAAGSPFTLTASVSPANLPARPTPTGTVTFLSSGATIGTATLSAGTTSLTLTNLAVGTDQITCQYSGDSTYAVSACNIVPVTVTATPTTLTLAASPNPAQAFQPITLTAHISSGNTTPPGQIGFFANGTAIGASPISASGVATLTINFPAGTDTLTASYVSPSTSTAAGGQSNPITENVNPDNSTNNLSVSPNPANQHTAVTLTAQVTAASSLTVPTGTITFLDGTNSLASVPVSATGGATYTSSSFAVGSHSLTAVYAGSPNDLASTSTPQTLTINAQDFSIDVPPPVTLRTGYHTTVNLTLTSTGNFADAVKLSCLELPQWATCNFNNATLALGANQTIPASIYFDTDAVLGYKSESRSPFALRTGFALAMLLPLGLLASPRRRKLLRRSTLLVALLVTATLLSATGCSSLYPASTPPGTYSITLTGQGQTSGISHQATFTLIVTE